MGRKTGQIRGKGMKLFIGVVFLCGVLLIPLPCLSFDRDMFDRGMYVLNALDELKNGDSQGKKIALRKLQILDVNDYNKNNQVFNPIIHALKDKDPSVREAAASTLKHIGEYSKGCCRDAQIVPSLIEALKDSNTWVRAEAAVALGYFTDERSLAPLAESLKDKDPWVRLNAAYAIGVVGRSLIKKEITRDLGPGSYGVRMERVVQKKKLIREKTVDELFELLRDDSDWRYTFARQECIATLRIIGANKTKTFPTLERKIMEAILQQYHDEYLKIEVMRTFIIFNTEVVPKEIFLDALRDSSEVMVNLAAQLSAKLLVDSLSLQERHDVLEIMSSLMMNPSKGIRLASLRILDRFVNYLTDTEREHVLELTINGLQDSDMSVRAQARIIFDKFARKYTLTKRQRDNVLEILKVLSKDQSGDIRLDFLRIAVIFMRQATESERRKMRELALSTVHDSSARVRAHSIIVLGQFKDSSSLDILLNGLNDDDWSVKRSALDMLSRHDDARILDELILFFGVTPPRNVTYSIEDTFFSVGRRNEKKAVDLLIVASGDSDPQVRFRVARTAHKFKDNRVEQLLIKLVDDPSALVREEAVNNLNTM
jgi:HEAT repeat protein